MDLVPTRPRVVVHTRATTEFAVLTWLLSAADDRKQARREWDDARLTLLRCGAIFSAVRIQGDVVRAAAGTDNDCRVDDFLAHMLEGGPVVVDSYAARYYAFVPVGTRRWWHVPGTECLGSGSYLGVPRPGLDDRDDGRSHWAVPMESPGALCSPDAVRQLVLVGQVAAGVQRQALEAGRDC